MTIPQARIVFTRALYCIEPDSIHMMVCVNECPVSNWLIIYKYASVSNTLQQIEPDQTGLNLISFIWWNGNTVTYVSPYLGVKYAQFDWVM